jgi:hypothetical protein
MALFLCVSWSGDGWVGVDNVMSGNLTLKELARCEKQMIKYKVGLEVVVRNELDPFAYLQFVIINPSLELPVNTGSQQILFNYLSYN